MIPEPLPRLESILNQLPAVPVTRALSVGCGIFPSALTLRRARPGWTLYGVDLDGVALRQARAHDPALHLLQIDIRDLPDVLRVPFGLILVRHPDLFRHPQTWEATIPRLPQMLSPGGTLLVTLYSPHEAAVLAGFTLPPPFKLDEGALAPVDLAGRDRYVRLFNTHHRPPASADR